MVQFPVALFVAGKKPVGCDRPQNEKLRISVVTSTEVPTGEARIDKGRSLGRPRCYAVFVVQSFEPMTVTCMGGELRTRQGGDMRPVRWTMIQTGRGEPQQPRRPYWATPRYA